MRQQNRRIAGRWKICMQAKAQLEGSEGWRDCIIADINFKGMQIFLQEKLPADSYIRLKIMLSQDFVLAVEVWVAWSKTQEGRHSYGLVFSKIQDSDKERIYQFIQRNFPKQIYNRLRSDIIIKKGGEDMDDRRLFERFSVQFPLKILDLNSGREGKGHVYDISAKGLSFLADEDLISNTPLEMWLEVPDKGEPFYTRGEVTWSEKVQPNKYRIGVDLERANLMGLSRVLRII